MMSQLIHFFLIQFVLARLRLSKDPQPVAIYYYFNFLIKLNLRILKFLIIFTE
jgi:hypothetical protein